MDRFLDFQYNMAMEELSYYCDNELESAMESGAGDAIKSFGALIKKAIMAAVKKIIEVFKGMTRAIREAIRKIKNGRKKSSNPPGTLALPEHAGPSVSVTSKKVMVSTPGVSIESGIEYLTEATNEFCSAGLDKLIMDCDTKKVSDLRRSVESACDFVMMNCKGVHNVGEDESYDIAGKPYKHNTFSYDLDLEHVANQLDSLSNKWRGIESQLSRWSDYKSYGTDRDGYYDKTTAYKDLQKIYTDIQIMCQRAISATAAMSAALEDNVIDRITYRYDYWPKNAKGEKVRADDSNMAKGTTYGAEFDLKNGAYKDR
jgi:hypothetical protein